MKKIKLYNKISHKGLDLFPLDQYEVFEDIKAEDAILVRSAKLHDVVFPKTLKAIARAGAGTNNIPIDACSEQGIVVFNTPGANANAVKELVFAGLLLASRPSFEGMNWVSSLSKEEDVAAADSEHCMAELICDGIHIHPAVVRTTFKIFGDDRIIFISDL